MSHTIRFAGDEVRGTGPPLDLAGLRREMEESGLNDLADELVQIFVDDAPVRMEALEAACDDGDPVAIRSAAHPFKSAATTVHAHRLGALLLEIEAAGRDGNAARASDLLPETRREYEAILAQCSFPPRPDRFMRGHSTHASRRRTKSECKETESL